MKTKYLILLSLSGALTVGCSREPAPVEPGQAVALEFAPVVSQAAETRGAIFGDASGRMPKWSSYGLFICEHLTGGANPYQEYALNYNNIQAYRSNTTGQWSYYYFGYTDGFPILFITPKDEDRDGVTDVNADIFAYAPYQQSVTTPESVPFSITDAVDVMYAAENTDPVTNKDIDPATDSRITPGADGARHLDVPLTFTHALALLEFEIRLKNNGYNHPFGEGTANDYRLDFIRIDRKEGGHPLYSTGMMDAMTGGTLTDLTAVNRLTVSGGNLGLHYTASNEYLYIRPNQTTKAYILQVPSQTGETYSDGDYTFAFKFADQVFPMTFTLLKEHIRHADGTTYGFQPGYRYTFKFMIDNYIHFEGVTIGEWDAVETPFQTEI